ncbi:MAG: FtsX-like permease family protein [Candidatus Omnitrophota bacterium]
MATFIKIAWRNIVRNSARSSITISAVAIGLTSLIFLKGFVDGADHQMVSNYTDMLIGHIQIHRLGFQKSMALDKTINNTFSVTGDFKKRSDIVAFSERIKDFALISSTEGSSGILLLGIDPENEKKVSTIHKRLIQGEFLGPEDNGKIIIGKTLAENLKVSLGDKVVLMSQASDGSTAAAAYDVSGILETGAEEIDKNLALVTLKAAQDLLVLNGKISEVVVKVSSLDNVDEVEAFLKTRINLQRYEVLSWKEISPMTYQWTQFDQVFTHLILVIVLVVVASGILNTILMGVLERTREFGIMLALGTKPNQILFMVALESFFLGLIGTVIGTACGFGFVFYFGIKGIDLSSISSALNSFFIGSVIYTRLNPVGMGIYALIVLLVSILVALFPAAKASRLKPIEAIHYI